jgi:hypothetical protein
MQSFSATFSHLGRPVLKHPQSIGILAFAATEFT